MDSALQEFAQKGYGASSVNTICSAQNISKGIIYHYFKSKDDLYLACIEECFLKLTEYLGAVLVAEDQPVEKQMEQYFSARIAFFREHPVYQPLFCEAVVSPPAHLKQEILLRRQAFDDQAIDTLTRLLEDISPCLEVTRDDVVETFREFQDFINAKYQFAHLSEEEFQKREQSCLKVVKILLYGVIARRE